MSVSSLVTCDWLNSKLSSNEDSGLVILDVTWFSDKDGRANYLSGHIPKAVHFDIMEGAVLSPLYPRNLPTPEVFQQHARAAGVNVTSHVVVYSDTDKHGYMTSGRAWWMFKYFGLAKVSVLDGGWQKWRQGGYQTTTEVPAQKGGDFLVKLHEDYRRDLDAVRAISAGGKGDQIVDSRAATAYQAAHIPRATSLQADDLIDKDKGVMKSPDELKKLFKAAGVDVTRPVVTHCNSGMSSCTLALAASLCGVDNWAVYTAGFTEWKNAMAEKDVKQGNS